MSISKEICSRWGEMVVKVSSLDRLTSTEQLSWRARGGLRGGSWRKQPKHGLRSSNLSCCQIYTPFFLIQSEGRGKTKWTASPQKLIPFDKLSPLGYCSDDGSMTWPMWQLTLSCATKYGGSVENLWKWELTSIWLMLWLWLCNISEDLTYIIFDVRQITVDFSSFFRNCDERLEMHCLGADNHQTLIQIENRKKHTLNTIKYFWRNLIQVIRSIICT